MTKELGNEKSLKMNPLETLRDYGVSCFSGFFSAAMIVPTIGLAVWSVGVAIPQAYAVGGGLNAFAASVFLGAGVSIAVGCSAVAVMWSSAISKVFPFKLVACLAGAAAGCALMLNPIVNDMNNKNNLAVSTSEATKQTVLKKTSLDTESGKVLQAFNHMRTSSVVMPISKTFNDIVIGICNRSPRTAKCKFSASGGGFIPLANERI